MHLALIGNPLCHSWSKNYFDNMFVSQGLSGYNYRLCPLATLDGLRQWAMQNNLQGFNVTLPYKEAVLAHLDSVSPEAQEIGAVNCVVVADGRMVGHNTDAPAFRQTLLPLLQPWHRKALILGTGGASKAVAYTLRQLGIDYSFVSRQPEGRTHCIGYAEATEEIADCRLLVNATPVGMYPNSEATPLPHLDGIGTQHTVYDLIYNPQETLLLRQCRQHGATVQNGLKMLTLQADLSWQLWHQH